VPFWKSKTNERPIIYIFVQGGEDESRKSIEEKENRWMVFILLVDTIKRGRNQKGGLPGGSVGEGEITKGGKNKENLTVLSENQTENKTKGGKS